MTEERSTGVQSVERALHILSIIADSPGDCTLGEVAMQAALPTTTTHRLLGALTQAGYVAREQGSSRYGLGSLLVLIGQRAVHKNQLIRVARPWLEALAEETSETVNLTARFADSVMQLDHVESRNLLRVSYPEGERFPMHASASGKLFLAYLPLAERERILTLALPPETPANNARRKALEKEVEIIRHKGYALDDAEREMGVRCVAAPILVRKGEASAAISISGPTLRIDVKRLHDLAGTLIQTADAIAQALTSARAHATSSPHMQA